MSTGYVNDGVSTFLSLVVTAGVASPPPSSVTSSLTFFFSGKV